ncbi:MAG: hypothetical protein GX231_06630 [Tissierellia bacterium]|nr:hypothetical protein [Tissierellia bacterium]
MTKEGFNKIEVILPATIVEKLVEIASKEKRTLNQQITLIMIKYLKEYDRILELINEEDFGVITEEKLRDFLSKRENQIDYKYDEIKDYSFDDLFQIWIDCFL